MEHFLLHSHSDQAGSSISRQNLNENLETLHLAPMLFYRLPGFHLKTVFLNPHPLSLLRIHIPKMRISQEK